MQTNKVLLAFVLAFVLYTTNAKKHHEKSWGNYSQVNEDEEDLSKVENADKLNDRHGHRLHKREAERNHERNGLRKDVEPVAPGPGSESSEPQPSSESGSQPNPQPQEPTDEVTPTITTTPPVPAADLHIDVGKVQVASQTDSCNGVLLEPTFILTSATCVYPNHTGEPYENITFAMGSETKPVKKVFRNPYWHLTGERKENFALLQLQQPMPHQNQKYLTSMVWSSYALEDLDDSFVANPDITGCLTASNTARRGDTIRHVDDKPVTLSCSNKGSFDPGSPIFRLVQGAPKVYGVYFGHCTTGSLDRAVSGSCGARISKQVFFDFCRQAAKEGVELTNCDSELLDKMNTNFPTTVFSKKGYDAMTLGKNNPKAVLLAYHSSKSPYYQPFVEDIEAIQRLKTVYKMFQFAVVDVDSLAVKVTAVPAMEYRTLNSKAFISYNHKYDFEAFKKFMDKFARIGAPPSGSTSFLQSIHLHKRQEVPGTSSSESPFTHLQVLSDGDHAGGASFLPSNGVTCDGTAGYYSLPDKSCFCLPTHFGGGSACELLTTVLERDCEYLVNDVKQSYTAIKGEVSEKTWCNGPKKTIKVRVTASGDVSGEKLEPVICADAIADLIECSSNNDLQIFQDERHKRSNVERRSPAQNTKTADAPTSYLENFDGNIPPGPTTNAPNTHYYTVVGEGATADATPYSVLFDGNRGIPTLVGYKVTNANLKLIDTSKTLMRNKWSSFVRLNQRMGSNSIYVGRSEKTLPEAVQEGQLNTNRMHSYNPNSMDLTFNHINAFPQYTDFARGVWRKYQEQIISYGKEKCSQKDPSATFYVLSGVSDYELTGEGTSAFLKATTYWPVAYEGAIPQPHLSPDLANGLELSIIIPKSAWTVGCCIWTAGGDTNAESVSFWANNKPRGIAKHEVQPDLRTLGQKVFPGKPCFQFFPATPQCSNPDNHYRMAPPA